MTLPSTPVSFIDLETISPGCTLRGDPFDSDAHCKSASHIYAETDVLCLSSEGLCMTYYFRRDSEHVSPVGARASHHHAKAAFRGRAVAVPESTTLRERFQ